MIKLYNLSVLVIFVARTLLASLKTDIEFIRKVVDSMFTLLYSFVGCFAALVVYNLFGGKQFVQKRINEAKEESKKEED